MKKQILFLIFAIFLTSCAPAQPPATSTFAPTAKPIPSATATLTPIPTVTSTPTDVPIPDHEYQVTDANGNIILVVNDELYKWENNKLVPVAMEDTTFENAIDASNATLALAPQEYFEGDQQALKNILFPEGVKVHGQLEQMGFKSLSRDSSVGGVGAYPIYGVPLSASRVQSEPTDNFQLVVLNMAVMGVDQPVPIVVGKVENGQYMFRNSWIYHVNFSADPIRTVDSEVREKISNIGDLKTLFGKPVEMEGVVHFREDRYDPNSGIRQEDKRIFRELMLKRFQAKKDEMVAAIGGYPSEPFKTNSGWINWLLDKFPGYDFDGFLMDSVLLVYDVK